MSNARGKQRRKPAGKRVVKTFDNTPDDAFERDAEEIYARQVENYTLAKAQIKQQEDKALEALGRYEGARKRRRKLDKPVDEVIKAIENYEATQQQLQGIEHPSIEAIREALSLHLVPQENCGNISEARRNVRAKKPASALEKEYPRGMHTYRGSFGKFLTCLDDADSNFRMAVELLETSESDRAIERLFEAVTAWVERLRIFVTAPPESCGEAASKIVREGLTFPINFAGLTTYARPAFTWLDELGFQKDCFPGVPREKGNAHRELFRQFAFHIVFRLAVLRAELEWRKPADAFEEKAAKLPHKPDQSWRECFKAAPAAFYGEDWALEVPQLGSFRRSFDGVVIPLHSSQAIRKWPADNIRLHQKSHRDPAMATNAEHLLKDFAKILFKPKKRGTRSGGSPS